MNVQVLKISDQMIELKKKIVDVSGDKGNMQSFVAKTGSDIFSLK